MSGDVPDYNARLREAAERRFLAAREQRYALDALNLAVREARAVGMSAQEIATEIGTSRQRVYEILREG